MDFLTSLPPAVFAITLALAIVALFALELLVMRRIGAIASPALEYARAQAEKEAEHILEGARESARALLARAEAAAAELTARRAQEDEAARHAHEEALHTVRERFEKLLTEITRMSQEGGEVSRAALAREIETLGGDARREFKSAIESSTKAFEAELVGALGEAREGAARYEHARRGALDTHISELVAQTTTIALARGLPEAVNAELVQRALEEAKAAHAF